jgi:long-chain acyl-CoA synthetase
MGLKPDDCVALLLPNCPQFLIAELGAWKAGAIVVPLNPLYSPDELRYLLADCGAETIVTLAPFYTRVKSVQPHTALKRIIATCIGEYLPPLLHVAYVLTHALPSVHRVQLQSGDAWLQSLLSSYAQQSPPTVVRGPHDPAVILMSGGTTGTPKGAVGLHDGPARRMARGYTPAISAIWTPTGICSSWIAKRI